MSRSGWLLVGCWRLPGQVGLPRWLPLAIGRCWLSGWHQSWALALPHNNTVNIGTGRQVGHWLLAGQSQGHWSLVIGWSYWPLATQCRCWLWVNKVMIRQYYCHVRLVNGHTLGGHQGQLVIGYWHVSCQCQAVRSLSRQYRHWSMLANNTMGHTSYVGWLVNNTQ